MGASNAPLNKKMDKYIIITPDGVGSTILQRTLTVGLNLHGHYTINTHELVNGIKINKGVISRDDTKMYTQSLDDIQNILMDSKTSIVSRLAKYHLDARRELKDSDQDHAKFFNFVNKFYDKKIVCLRRNVFEYAMSWSIREKSNVINVYNKEDKDKVLQVNEVDEKYFIRKCKEYKEYFYWIDHFKPHKIFYYEDFLKEPDKVLSELAEKHIDFKQHFNLSLKELLKNEYTGFNNLVLQQHIDLDKNQMQALVNYKLYNQKLQKQNIIPGMSPIKNTSLADKQKQIKNFQNCLDLFYNFVGNDNWIDKSIATYDFWNDKSL